jgi:hypothetical protein
MGRIEEEVEKTEIGHGNTTDEALQRQLCEITPWAGAARQLGLPALGKAMDVLVKLESESGQFTLRLVKQGNSSLLFYSTLTKIKAASISRHTALGAPPFCGSEAWPAMRAESSRPRVTASASPKTIAVFDALLLRSYCGVDGQHSMSQKTRLWHRRLWWPLSEAPPLPSPRRGGPFAQFLWHMLDYEHVTSLDGTPGLKYSTLQPAFETPPRLCSQTMFRLSQDGNLPLVILLLQNEPSRKSR